MAFNKSAAELVGIAALVGMSTVACSPEKSNFTPDSTTPPAVENVEKCEQQSQIFPLKLNKVRIDAHRSLSVVPISYCKNEPPSGEYYNGVNVDGYEDSFVGQGRIQFQENVDGNAVTKTIFGGENSTMWNSGGGAIINNENGLHVLTDRDFVCDVKVFIEGVNKPTKNKDTVLINPKVLSNVINLCNKQVGVNTKAVYTPQGLPKGLTVPTSK